MNLNNSDKEIHQTKATAQVAEGSNLNKIVSPEVIRPIPYTKSKTKHFKSGAKQSGFGISRKILVPTPSQTNT